MLSDLDMEKFGACGAIVRGNVRSYIWRVVLMMAAVRCAVATFESMVTKGVARMHMRTGYEK